MELIQRAMTTPSSPDDFDRDVLNEIKLDPVVYDVPRSYTEKEQEDTVIAVAMVIAVGCTHHRNNKIEGIFNRKLESPMFEAYYNPILRRVEICGQDHNRVVDDAFKLLCSKGLMEKDNVFDKHNVELFKIGKHFKGREISNTQEVKLTDLPDINFDKIVQEHPKVTELVNKKYEEFVNGELARIDKWAYPAAYEIIKHLRSFYGDTVDSFICPHNLKFIITHEFLNNGGVKLTMNDNKEKKEGTVDDDENQTS
jgi:hypothetical protein